MWQIEGGWGDWKQDYRIGQLTALNAEINRDRKKRPQPYKAEDFALRPKDINQAKMTHKKRIKAAFDMLALPKGKKK